MGPLRPQVRACHATKTQKMQLSESHLQRLLCCQNFWLKLPDQAPYSVPEPGLQTGEFSLRATTEMACVLGRTGHLNGPEGWQSLQLHLTCFPAGLLSIKRKHFDSMQTETPNPQSQGYRKEFRRQLGQTYY